MPTHISGKVLEVSYIIPSYAPYIMRVFIGERYMGSLSWNDDKETRGWYWETTFLGATADDALKNWLTHEEFTPI